MKIKDDFITHDTGEETVIVSVSGDFNGMIKNNETAAFIVEQLMEDVTEEDIVEAMYKEYDAPKDIIKKDVHDIIDKLVKLGVVE